MPRRDPGRLMQNGMGFWPAKTLLSAVMMSLNMLIEFGEAFDFTGRDFDGWCRKVGFRRSEVIPLRGPASAAVAYK